MRVELDTLIFHQGEKQAMPAHRVPKKEGGINPINLRSMLHCVLFSLAKNERI